MIKLLTLFFLIFLLPKADATFVDYGWINASSGGAGTIFPWQPNQQYQVNAAVYYGTALYAAQVAHTSGTSFANNFLIGDWRLVANLDMGTFLLSGGDLTVNALNVDYTAGDGIFIDDFTDPFLSTIDVVHFNAGTIAACGLGINSYSTFYVTPAGVVECAVGAPNQSTYSRNIVLGYARHLTAANIESVQMRPWFGVNTNAQFRDLILFLGYLKKGFQKVSGNAGLTLNMAQGLGFSIGFGYPDDEFPNTVNLAARLNFTFTPSTADTFNVDTTTLNTALYQPNGTGNLVPINANQFTWAPIFITKDKIFIQYGQKTFGTMGLARTDLSTSYMNYLVNPSLVDACWSSTIIFKSGALSTIPDDTTFDIINYAGGCNAGSSAGSSGGAASGDVFGPAASTLNAIPKWGDTAGDTLKDSGVLISDTNNDITGARNLTINGTLIINNNGANSVQFPTGRGANNQVLTSNGTGGASWLNASAFNNVTNLAVTVGTWYELYTHGRDTNNCNIGAFINGDAGAQNISFNENFRISGGLGWGAFNVYSNLVAGTKIFDSIGSTFAGGSYVILIKSAIAATISLGINCEKALGTSDANPAGLGTVRTYGNQYGQVAL